MTEKEEAAMNFDDTPQEAEFRSTARKWVDANAPKEFGAELSKSSLGRIRLAIHAGDFAGAGAQLSAEFSRQPGRAYRRMKLHLLEALLRLRPHLESENFAIEMEMVTKMAKLGLNIFSVPVSYDPRLGDSSLNPIRDGARILKMFIDNLSWRPSDLATLTMPALLLWGAHDQFAPAADGLRI